MLLTHTASKSAVHAPRPACVLSAVSPTRSRYLPSRAARRFGRSQSAVLLPMVSNGRHGPPRDLGAFQLGAVAVDGRFRRRRRWRCSLPSSVALGLLLCTPGDQEQVCARLADPTTALLGRVRRRRSVELTGDTVVDDVSCIIVLLRSLAI